MKILFCNYEYPPIGGGGGVMNALMAEELAKRHEVTVLTSQALGLPRESNENGVRLVRVPVFFRKRRSEASLLSMLAYIPGAILVGKRLIQQNRYDLINTYFVLPTGPVGDVLARYAGIPNVLSFFGGDLYDPSKFTSPHRHPFLRAWVKSLLQRADILVGESRNMLSIMHIFYAPEIQAMRIPLAIRSSGFGQASRADYGFNKDDFLMVTVGRLVRRKAVHQLLAMIAILRHYNVRLIVVGSGPQESHLQAEARRRRIEDKVWFTGYVEEAEKYRLLKISDIYVSTTQHEGFCLSFLEAMTAGLPIVTYDHGGHTDFLQDYRTGYLVPLNNLDLFIERCKALMNDPALRISMGETNKRRVEDYYIDACARSYEAIFNEVLNLNPQARQVEIMRSPTASLD